MAQAASSPSLLKTQQQSTLSALCSHCLSVNARTCAVWGSDYYTFHLTDETTGSAGASNHKQVEDLASQLLGPSAAISAAIPPYRMSVTLCRYVHLNRLHLIVKFQSLSCSGYSLVIGNHMWLVASYHTGRILTVSTPQEAPLGSESLDKPENDC